MNEVLERLKPEIEKTIEGLNHKKFTPDPIAGAHFSRIVSLMSSAYKRHGRIIERAIVETLALYPDLEVWADKEFHISNTTDHIVNPALKEPSLLVGTDTAYLPGSRTLQIDALVYNRRTKHLGAYEIKRGGGAHDAGKREQLLRNILRVQTLLKSYGTTHRRLDLVSSSSHGIFYYGKCSLPSPFSLTRSDLDEHFGHPVVETVETVNKYFQDRLFGILAGP